MPLREPIEVSDARDAGPVHFIAIGGAGMSGVAQLFHDLGVAVQGSDQNDSPALQALAAQGIQTWVGHDPAHLGDARTVVVSSAIRDDNPELVEARRRGLQVWHRSAALAALMVGRRGVAIAGTHGKTTTTGMTAVQLTAAGADPSYVIGAPLAASGTSAHLGGGDVFVIEADESDGTFLQYPAEIAVVTNVEADHLDNWGTPQEYFAGFERFATAPGVRAVVVSGDDAGAVELTGRLQASGSDVRIVRYGEAEGCEVQLTDVQLAGTTASAQVSFEGRTGRLDLQVPGRHNLANAAAAYAVGRLLGCEHDALLAGAHEFGGTLRRFQHIGDAGGVRIFDDYAHHPTEIRATLGAARRAVEQGRVIACFQPHLFSRTRDFADEFGEALALADLVVLTDIYAAREDPMPGVTGELLVETAGAHGAQVVYVPDKFNLPSALAQLVEPGDVVLTIGAGDVTLVGPMLLAELQAGSAGRAAGDQASGDGESGTEGTGAPAGTHG